ncbi:MAG TPA: hypothetical protein VJ934_06085, partial [Desulfomicrobiaceae bacterium]|nr:hypothetical protein [Desulfomicrobiaceae bacterium]
MMKIRNKMILPIAGLVIISVLGAVFAVRTTISTMVEDQKTAFLRHAEENLSHQAEKRKRSIYESIEALGRDALGQAALFSQLPQIESIYATALTGNQNDEADPILQQSRDELRQV